MRRKYVVVTLSNRERFLIQDPDGKLIWEITGAISEGADIVSLPDGDDRIYIVVNTIVSYTATEM